MINFGIVYGLSAYGLADRLQIAQEEAQEFIERYLDRFPAVRRFIDETIALAREQGYVRRCSGGAGASPSCARATGSPRSSASAWPSTRSSRARRRTSSSWRWCAPTTRLHERRAATRLILQIHDELLFEGPEAEASGRRSSCARDGGARADPPLAVDVGVGANWLEAK